MPTLIYPASHLIKPGLSVQPDRSHPRLYGCVSWWRFAEGEGTTIYDNSYPRRGTLSGTSWVRDEQRGEALSFATSSNDIANTGNWSVGGQGLTLCAWINPKSFSISDARIISKSNGTSAGNHWFMLSTIVAGGGISIRFRLKVSGVTNTLVPGSASLSTGIWSHAAATYDGSNMRLIQDGVELASMSKTGPMDVSPNVNVGIGNNPMLGQGFDGMIDDVRIYNRALSPAELRDIYSNPYAEFQTRRYGSFAAAGGPTIIPVSLSLGANAQANTLHTASFSQTTGITAQSGMGPSNTASSKQDSNLLASLSQSSNSTTIKTALSALLAKAATSGGVSAFSGRVVDLGATSTQVFNMTALAAQVTSLPASAFLSSTPQSTLDVLIALQAQATASSFSTILFQAVQQFAATSGFSLTAQQVLGVFNAVTSLSISGNMTESVSASVQANIQEAVTANVSPQVLSLFQAVAALPVSASQAFLAATVSNIILASLGLGAKTGLSQGLDMASLVQSVLQTQAGMTGQSTFNASGLVAFPTAAHQALTASLVAMIFQVLVDLGATTDINNVSTQQAVAATALGLQTELATTANGLQTVFLGLGLTAQQSSAAQRIFFSMLTIALSSSLATGATVTTLQIGPVLKFLSEQLLTPTIVNETLE